MGRVTFTKAHINRGKLIDPGWYESVIKAVKEQDAKNNDGSITYVVDLKIIESGPFEECEVRRYFNEKDDAIPFMMPFVKALLGRELEPGETIEINEGLVGRQLSVFYKTGEYNGAPKNEAADFAPSGTVH